LHQLHVDPDLLAKVKVVINHLDQLLQHVICGWLVGAVNGHFHHFVQCELIDAFVVAAVGCPEDGIGDVAANQLSDGLNHTFCIANDQFIDDVQSVSFLLRLCLCGDGVEDGFADHCCELVRSFLSCFGDGAGRDYICRFYQHEQIIPVVEELLHALARVAQVKLADEHMPNAFLQ
jgi:hypothetical protein